MAKELKEYFFMLKYYGSEDFKTIRKARGFTLKQVAEVSKMSKQTISNYENRPDITTDATKIYLSYVLDVMTAINKHLYAKDRVDMTRGRNANIYLLAKNMGLEE